MIQIVNPKPYCEYDIGYLTDEERSEIETFVVKWFGDLGNTIEIPKGYLKSEVPWIVKMVSAIPEDILQSIIAGDFLLKVQL